MGKNNKSEKSFLIKEHYNKPYFYIIPKIDKNSLCPPSRPIVAGMGGISSAPSDFLDHFLQLLISDLPA